MKPANHAQIITKNAAGLRGGEGLPLSELAADNKEQRAENFPFEPQDKALVEAVLQSSPRRATTAGPGAPDRARLVALNMALSGTSRAETERHLREAFQVEEPKEILDEVYSQADRVE